jgi:hypothetical protein
LILRNEQSMAIFHCLFDREETYTEKLASAVKPLLGRRPGSALATSLRQRRGASAASIFGQISMKCASSTAKPGVSDRPRARRACQRPAGPSMTRQALYFKLKISVKPPNESGCDRSWRPAPTGPATLLPKGRGIPIDCIDELTGRPRNAANRRGVGNASDPDPGLTGHDPGPGVA